MPRDLPLQDGKFSSVSVRVEELQGTGGRIENTIRGGFFTKLRSVYLI